MACNARECDRGFSAGPCGAYVGRHAKAGHGLPRVQDSGGTWWGRGCRRGDRVLDTCRAARGIEQIRGGSTRVTGDRMCRGGNHVAEQVVAVLGRDV